MPGYVTALERQLQMLEYFRRPISLDYVRFLFDQGRMKGRDDDHQVKMTRDTLRALFQTGETYWVRAKVNTPILTCPPPEIDPEEYGGTLAQTGCVWFEDPISIRILGDPNGNIEDVTTPVYLHGMGWVSFAEEGRPGGRIVAVGLTKSSSSSPPFHICGIDHVNLDDQEQYEEHLMKSDLLLVLIQFWNFINTKVVGGWQQPLDRGTRRRAQRAGMDPNLTVITLRKTQRKDATDAGLSNPVLWTHSHPVRPHPHRYWCGSGEERHLEWRQIKEYWKNKHLPRRDTLRVFDVNR